MSLDPISAGLHLIQAQALNASSTAGREATWLAFIQRFNDRGIPFFTASATELKSIALNHRHGMRPKEHALRLLRLAETVIDQLQNEGLLPKGRNAATEARFGLNVDCVNDQTVFLSTVESIGLINTLCPANGVFCAEGRDVRDAAMVALALGAGAPPTALLATTVSCIQDCLSSKFIRLALPQASPKRLQAWSAMILPFAQPVLVQYFDQIAQWPADALAFPGRQGQPMSRVQIFRIIQKFLKRGAFMSRLSRVGPQTLRNTYFRLMLEEGYDTAQISKSMGWVLGDQEQFRRMRRSWLAQQQRELS
jgi:hypothetical protein